MDHAKKVALLQDQLRHHTEEATLGHSLSNTLRNGAYKKKATQLDLRAFDEILAIDHESVTVEPRITFRDLCRYTLKRGYLPPVVPEFSTITVGGAIMGAALESSSHRYGQVSDTCLEYECLLGNGERVIASPTKNSDLFYAVSGSYGTLAILTAVKLRLIPAKPFVNLNIHEFNNLGSISNYLTQPQSAEFVEGVAFSPRRAVAITGKMSDHPAYPLVRQNRPWSKWYIQSLDKEMFSMRTEEYLFRFDRSAFWMGSYIASFTSMMRLFFTPTNPKLKKHSLSPSSFFRLLFGWGFSSKRLYKIWHSVPNAIAEKLFFVHDFYAPNECAKEVLAEFSTTTQIFPIWLCPTKGTETPQFLSPHFGKQRFLNIGLYGIPANGKEIPALTAELEEKICSYGGRKMLYSFTYYTPQLFAKIYDEPRYRTLRQQFFAEKAFPTLYNKVKIC